MTIRDEIDTWLAANWDPQRPTRDWWRLLADAGWAAPDWPAEHGGRGCTAAEAETVRAAIADAGALGPPSGAGPQMGVPILLEFGTPEQRTRWLGPLIRGEEAWGQFFSEPDAGSDLANVSARAVRDGDEWVVDGQKVWNSGTNEADRALLVARTSTTDPKHRGLTFFIIDVHQPGVEVRPIRQMNGAEEFNEAFLDGARIPDDQRIGAVDGGWAVAMYVLAHERATSAGGGDTHLHQVTGGERWGNLDRTAGEAYVRADLEQPANRLPISDLDTLLALAREHGRLDDPVLRQDLMSLHAMEEALRLTTERAKTGGGAAEAMSSVGYLGAVRVVRRYRDLVGSLAGAAAMLGDGDVAESITTAPCHGIQGGTEQIQMNVIGERILGLPREPRP